MNRQTRTTARPHKPKTISNMEVPLNPSKISYPHVLLPSPKAITSFRTLPQIDNIPGLRHPTLAPLCYL
jgi:hypothetical protein